MSVCEHDPYCPGHGPAHDKAVQEAAWPTCWCALSPGYGHLWHPGACPSAAVTKDAS